MACDISGNRPVLSHVVRNYPSVVPLSQSDEAQPVMMQSASVSNPRPLFLALYGVALAFVLPSLMEFFLVTFPYRPGEANWRFGATGLLYNSVVVSPLFGLGLAAVVGYFLEQRAVMRTVAIIAFVIAVFLLISFPFFILDFLQLRQQVNPGGRQAYDYVSLKAVLTGGIMALAAIGLGLGAWRSAPPKLSGPAARKAAAPGKIVVGQN